MLPLLEDEDVALVAVSYDRVDELATFAERHGIRYPLLADVGSVVITELGLLNEQVQEQHAAYGIEPNERHRGVPYPGVVLLDEHGVVATKRFFESYRERETGAGLLERVLGIAAGVHGPATGGHLGPVAVSLRFDADGYTPWQRLRLYVDVTPAPGWHVIAPGSPPELTPLEIVIRDQESMMIGDAEWPEAKPLEVAGVTGGLWVYDGAVSGSIPLSFRVRPGAGPMTVAGEVRVQACSDEECLIPGAVLFALTLEEGRFLRPGT